jgi:hypothetical protein
MYPTFTVMPELMRHPEGLELTGSVFVGMTNFTL